MRKRNHKMDVVENMTRTENKMNETTAKKNLQKIKIRKLNRTFLYSMITITLSIAEFPMLQTRMNLYANEKSEKPLNSKRVGPAFTLAVGNENTRTAREYGFDSNFIAGAGINIKNQDADRFIYHLSAFLYFDLMRYESFRARSIEPSSDFPNAENDILLQNRRKGRQIFQALPGPFLKAGVALCARKKCEITIGRDENEIPMQRDVLGQRGSISGLHLRYEIDGLARVRINPVLFQADYDNRYRKIRDNIPVPIFISRDTGEEGKNVSIFPGRRIEFSGNRGGLSWGFFHETLFLPASTIDGREGTQLRKQGIGIGLEKGKSIRTRTFLTVDRTYGFMPAKKRNDDGEKSKRMQGYALRMGAGLLYRSFELFASAFVPQPELRTAGSKPSSQEVSGYILWGANPLESNVLGEMLDFRPATIPYLNRGGEQVQNLNDPYRWRNHTRIMRTGVRYLGDSVKASFAYILASPMRKRIRGNIFYAGAEEGTERLFFKEYEGSVELFFAKSDVRLEYARAYMYRSEDRKEIRRSLMGETLRITFRRRF